MTVETDASDYAIAATLSQEDRPVAFFSRTLSATERAHPSIEKEASAIVESLRKWRQLLIGRTFKLITDQRSISFMFNQQHTSKIKNEKIQHWRLELSSYNFDIIWDTVSVCTFNMPLTPAGKQRRYRERRKNNPEKEAESKRKDLERYHANKRLVRDLTTREHRAIKKKWRSANAKRRDKARTHIVSMHTPESSPSRLNSPRPSYFKSFSVFVYTPAVYFP
ncbi:uncharacterized protein LOC131847958 [Achroia grisella]|uniref:uncharacterized protein LOC131847958 n=1 Tax=Achroia grisella TaxID=688607 RepID=UPI0027D1F441|nr:uncharacterized protein LOC131847958 [Achroia grisella]